ncbi:MAG: hypothetical protein AABY22_21090 [Nanoarchaeota archaeon]
MKLKQNYLILLKVFMRRNIPHKMTNNLDWVLPIWWVFFFGGWYDSGNGYGWRPNIFYAIRNKLRK